MTVPTKSEKARPGPRGQPGNPGQGAIYDDFIAEIKISAKSESICYYTA
jgi:hypothetical protein